MALKDSPSTNAEGRSTFLVCGSVNSRNTFGFPSSVVMPVMAMPKGGGGGGVFSWTGGGGGMGRSPNGLRSMMI